MAAPTTNHPSTNPPWGMPSFFVACRARRPQ